MSSAPVFSAAIEDAANLRFEPRPPLPTISPRCDLNTINIREASIAIVDDEEMNIEVVQGYLEDKGCQRFIRTTDSTLAFSLIKETSPDLVLLDIMMPQVSGLEILAAMRSDKRLARTPVIVLTASSSQEAKLEALRLGASEFLAKPVDASELILRIHNALIIKRYQDRLAKHSFELERQVEQRTRELVESRQRIISCLARAAEFRDNETGYHVVRVGKYAAVLARALGFDSRWVEILEHAAQLHDIGKIGVPDAILHKPGKLDAEEYELIKRHCSYGRSIITPMTVGETQEYRRHTEIGASLLNVDGYPIMEMAATIAQTHHERWDGTGYPLGLAGEDIPIEGRITAVADVYDALSSKRPYKQAMSREACFETMQRGRGQHFDPKVLDALLTSHREITAIQVQCADVDPLPNA